VVTLLQESVGMPAPALPPDVRRWL